MKSAGLTHGGFYAHFASRDELVAEAIRTAAEATGARVLSEHAGDLQATLSAYLSPEHVAHPEVGCVLAALGTDGRTQAAPVRRAFAYAAKGFVGFIDRKVRRRPRGSGPSDEALLLSAQMIGAVILARLFDDPALAARMLEVARRQGPRCGASGLRARRTRLRERMMIVMQRSRS